METSDRQWQWNPAFFVESSNDDNLVLRNDMTGTLVVLSRAEYDLLQAFSTNNRYDFVSKAMAEYEISEHLFQSVVRKAQQIDILILSASAAQDRKRRQSLLKLKLIYLANLFVSLLQHFTRRPLRAECTGNLRFFKLCSIDLKGGLLYHLATNRRFQKALPFVYFTCLAGLIVLVICSFDTFQFAGFAVEHISVYGLFFALLFSICLCLFWHECGHYIIYKRYGGDCDRMGLGTLFCFFPVFYTQVGQINLWTDRRKRLLLTAAGIMADIMVLLALSAVLSVWHRACFFNLLLDCLFFYYIVQIITNLNVLIPGTDGYYLFEELLGCERLYGRAFETFKSLWRGIIGAEKTQFSLRQFGLLVYFILCCINITGYWVFVVLWLTFPSWAAYYF